MTTGYRPQFDIDRPYGEAGEDTARHILGLSRARIEVKRKRRYDSRFYVEVAQDPGRRGQYKPSGVNTSTAEYWAFVIAGTGIVVFLPRAHLLEHAIRIGYPAAERDGNNPTRGFTFDFERLLRELRKGAL